jgi:hypothetical protein
MQKCLHCEFWKLATDLAPKTSAGLPVVLYDDIAQAVGT